MEIRKLLEQVREGPMTLEEAESTRGFPNILTPGEGGCTIILPVPRAGCCLRL